jgi:hypothetical protein
MGLVLLRKTCRLCVVCEMLIAHEAEVTRVIEGFAPHAAMPPYLVLGTLGSGTWRDGMSGGARRSNTTWPTSRRTCASRSRRGSGSRRTDLKTDRRAERLVYDRVVPEISRFFGIVVFMNYNDHPPPHFHVRYAEQRAIVAIESPAVLDGDLSPRALGLVLEWAAAHREELLEDWNFSGSSSR